MNVKPQKQSYLFWAMAIEWGLLVPDLVAALVSGSVTMYATLLRSSVEAVALTMAWLVVRRIARGGSAGYDYGVGKLENLSGLAVAGFLFVSLLTLMYEVMHRFHDPVALSGWHCLVALAITLVATGIDAWFLVRNRRLARLEHSPVMEAQWRMYAVKVVSGLIAIASLGLGVLLAGYAWSVYIDPAGSMLMLGFIMFSIGSILRRSVWDLLDRTLDEPLQLRILKVLARHEPEYRQLHGIRSRRSGTCVFIELLLEFDPTRPLGAVQTAIETMAAELERDIPGSVVLIAPVRDRKPNYAGEFSQPPGAVPTEV